ncbi:hypothetical protein SRIMM317S_04937 [Streptomyces rimosus subsp. rimosus]
MESSGRTARPGAVRAHQQGGFDGAAVGERHLVAALAEGAGTADLVPPADGARRERIEQGLPQLAALHLGAPARAVVRLVEQDGPVPVEDAQRLTALQDQAMELVHQVGCLEGELPVVVVDVEQPALMAGRGGGLRLVDGGRYAVDVQDAGECEAAETGADDRYVSGHGGKVPGRADGLPTTADNGPTDGRASGAGGKGLYVPERTQWARPGRDRTALVSCRSGTL